MACSVKSSCGSYLKDFTFWEGFLYFLYSACALWPLVPGLLWHMGFSEEGCSFFSLSCGTLEFLQCSRSSQLCLGNVELCSLIWEAASQARLSTALLPLLSNIDLLLRNCPADRSIGEWWSPGFVRMPHRALSLPKL